jgi:hypothetical protein
MQRRSFIIKSGLAGMAGMAGRPFPVKTTLREEKDDRSLTAEVMRTIAEPVLVSLSRGELKKNMPVQCRAGEEESRAQVTYLEAFGRLMAGLGPWIELDPDGSPEADQRDRYLGLSIQSLEMAVDPRSPDFMNFTELRQPLVDAAFLAHGLLRSSKQMLSRISGDLKTNLVKAMISTRIIRPPYNNWLLFSAMVEALLMEMGQQADLMRMDLAVKKHLEWYKGDGWYGDGPSFHWDYYNSFVIQPMLLEVIRILVDHGHEEESLYQEVLDHARRYAIIQERLISPEATYPPIGRSLAYRFGAFQLLSQLALHHQLPEELPPAQVRSALTALILKQFSADGTLDQEGWLRIGFYGDQPEIGENYISTGSLYLCSVGLLHLGLSPADPFWTGPAREWTSKKAWNGESFPIDHARG